MALRKTRPIADDNGDKMQSIMDHQILRILYPALGFILVGIVSWLFTTVLDLDESFQTQNVRIEHIHEEFEKIQERLDKMNETLTDVRVHVGRVTAH